MTVRLGRLVEQVTSISASRPLPFLALEHLDAGFGAVLADVELNEVTPDPTGMLQFTAGDVLFGKLRPYLAKSWLADRDGYCSTELIAMRPRADAIEGRWLAYLVQSKPFVGWAVATSDGVKMPRTSWEKLRLYQVAPPAITDQRAIADNLDAETARIGHLIAAHRRLLRVLAERRSSLLTAAFARTDNARTRLKRLLAQPPCYGVLVPRFLDDGVPFVRVNDLEAISRNEDPRLAIEPDQSAEYQRTVVEGGDILLSVVGSVDKVAVVPDRLAGANVARAVCRLVPAHGVCGELLALWLQTPQFREQALRSTSADTAQPTLGMEDVANFSVAYPIPTARDAFLRELKIALGRLEGAQAAAEREIDLLLERRQALITAAVVGQLEIPRVAA